MKPLLASVLLLLFTSAVFQQEKITVAVAANAQYAMKEIEVQYEKETGTQIELVISSSGKLTAQIKEGAPYDVFLSADMEFPEALYKEGLTVDAPKIYGYGKLILWTMKNLDLKKKDLLLSPGVKTIAIANPKVAPYGEAAISAMKFSKQFEKAEKKIVYGESISQVSQYIFSQTADVGFTAKSVVLSPEMKNKGKWIDVDIKAYSPIAQGAALLKASRNKGAAEKFYKYLYSEKAKAVFRKYGYTTSH
jgi:molybdate transport system substrate-binding protein